MIEKNHILFIFMIVLMSLLGLFIRSFGFGYQTSDMILWESWMNDMLCNGSGITCLLDYSGDYAMPYVFLVWLMSHFSIPIVWSIKFASIFMDYMLAVFSGLLIYEISNKKHFFLFGYGLIMFLPTVIMDGAYWGQCDSFYSALVMACLLFLIKEKYGFAFLFLGLSFSFKFQTIFIIPFLLIYYWTKKKFSILYFLIVPTVMLAMNIPAYIAGYPVSIAFSQFFNQSGEYPWLYYFYPNVWIALQARPNMYYMFGNAALLLAVTILLLFVIGIVKKDIIIDRNNYLPIAIWTIYSCAMWLPSMHERYGYLAEILACLYAIAKPKKAWLGILIVISVIPKYLWALGIWENWWWLQIGCAVVNISTYIVFSIFLFMELGFIRSRRMQLSGK